MPQRLRPVRTITTKRTNHVRLIWLFILQGRPDPLAEFVTATKDFDFEILGAVAIDHHPGILIVLGTLQLRGHCRVSSFDTID